VKKKEKKYYSIPDRFTFLLSGNSSVSRGGGEKKKMTVLIGAFSLKGRNLGKRKKETKKKEREEKTVERKLRHSTS